MTRDVLKHIKRSKRNGQSDASKTSSTPSSGETSSGPEIRMRTSYREWGVRVLYLSTVFIIAYFYSVRLISRNTAWKDDATLFLDGMNVCPNSAKLHLQVAKLKLNEANPKEARKLIEEAKVIDPEFCDIEYQEAILKIMYENDLEGGLKIAAKNLRCIYTNMQSLELLQKVWQQQMAGNPKNAALVENIGTLLVSGGLYLPGGKKLQEGVVMAFEQKNYLLALRISSKAEEIIPEMLGDRTVDHPDDMVDMMHELACYIYFLGGSIRGAIAGELKAQSMQKRRYDAAELDRAHELLIKVLQPNCTRLTATGPLEYSVMAYNSLTNLLNVETQLRRISQEDSSSNQNDVKKEEEIAMFYSNASIMFSSYVYKMNAVSAPSFTYKISEFTRHQKDTVKNAVKWWDQAGQSHFALNEFEDAVRCFERAMEWGVNGELGDDGKLKKGTVCPCSVRYWYAHALAGTPHFADNLVVIKKSVDALHFVSASCKKDKSVPKEMRELAEKQAKQLEEKLHSQKSSIDVDVMNQ
eukprot:CAMPEP_0182417372 /NCGR_PEP_ID=MMETSP1167-20130531/1833_1 /TAXON_ID=2988 /ORGANISM="Mallomonas Sp, Strain CCMP3275" /LENGTH=524 /DNA_ID=CAMNT_0024590889 /DNA_START=499 /DNA_END=2073 /DNA_ORIENTATION=-